MQFNFYRPTNPVLSDLMEGYYFLSGLDKDSSLSYYTFPNNYFIISVLENAQIDIEENKVTCTPSPYPNFQSNLTCKYVAPLMINYQGPINELTIYFKPLGLHAFVPNLVEYDKAETFMHFNPFSDFGQAMKHIFRIHDRSEQIALLEQYWLSKNTSAIDPLLPEMLDEIEKGKNISEIAGGLNISRQYLNRIFMKYLGKTPLEFRKIQRFRNAVRDRTRSKTLTELGLDSYFYDQSHFIRIFKSLTSLSPKVFFNKIDFKQENLWLYV